MLYASNHVVGLFFIMMHRQRQKCLYNQQICTRWCQTAVTKNLLTLCSIIRHIYNFHSRETSTQTATLLMECNDYYEVHYQFIHQGNIVEYITLICTVEVNYITRQELLNLRKSSYELSKYVSSKISHI